MFPSVRPRSRRPDWLSRSMARRERESSCPLKASTRVERAARPRTRNGFVLRSYLGRFQSDLGDGWFKGLAKPVACQNTLDRPKPDTVSNHSQKPTSNSKSRAGTKRVAEELAVPPQDAAEVRRLIFSIICEKGGVQRDARAQRDAPRDDAPPPLGKDPRHASADDRVFRPGGATRDSSAFASESPNGWPLWNRQNLVSAPRFRTSAASSAS